MTFHHVCYELLIKDTADFGTDIGMKGGKRAFALPVDTPGDKVLEAVAEPLNLGVRVVSTGFSFCATRASS